jgi:hypothetical protein
MTTATQTWPTLEELRVVDQAFSEALHQLELVRRRLTRLVDIDIAPSTRDGVPQAVPADVGALSWLVAAVELDLETADADFRTVRRIRDAVALESVE